MNLLDGPLYRDYLSQPPVAPGLKYHCGTDVGTCEAEVAFGTNDGRCCDDSEAAALGTDGRNCLALGTDERGCPADGTDDRGCPVDGTDDRGCPVDGTDRDGCPVDGTNDCAADGTDRDGCGTGSRNLDALPPPSVPAWQTLPLQ
ncbi:MAG: hypothetical protein K2X03_00060 [Bryobacteraceae bacterium]|nr:hypothetical protein [Bryobacteraceae bacterium]